MFVFILTFNQLRICINNNLTKSSLFEGLVSDFFRYMRENEHLLETEGSPCALFSHQEELGRIVVKYKAIKAGMFKIFLFYYLNGLFNKAIL